MTSPRRPIDFLEVYPIFRRCWIPSVAGSVASFLAGGPTATATATATESPNFASGQAEEGAQGGQRGAYDENTTLS
ncbi:hypothetical protein SVAN01_11629 [Stagonosporopsis vannaccii]|nr:hypothetical protein SVAN01_11629 [Stagonosporopsis vannaccii]